MEQTYCIYKLTNIVNGKGYIGFTSDFKRRLREHKKTASKGQGQAIHAAIRKNGWENFVAEELYYSYDKQHTLDFEDHFINLYETKGLKGYNITRGGQSGFSKEKGNPVSEKMKQLWTDPLYREQQVAAHKDYYANGGIHPMAGKTHTSESIQKMSETTKAMVTPEQREQMRQMSLAQWQDPKKKANLLARIRNPSIETRRKMSQAKKGNVPWATGRVHTQASIERMSAAHQGKKATLETRQKMSASRSAYLTEERRQEISEKMKGRQFTAESKSKIGAANGSKYTYRVTLPNGSQEIVTYLAEFARSHGIKQATVRAAVKNRNVTKTGYKFERINPVSEIPLDDR